MDEPERYQISISTLASELVTFPYAKRLKAQPVEVNPDNVFSEFFSMCLAANVFEEYVVHCLIARCIVVRKLWLSAGHREHLAFPFSFLTILGQTCELAFPTTIVLISALAITV